AHGRPPGRRAPPPAGPVPIHRTRGTPHMTAVDPGPRATAAPPAPAGIEANGLNVIAESERRGRSRGLFWPWFGANVSVLGLGYGAFVLAFGISFWQALIVGVVGITLSFVLCGLVAIAGKRG